MTIKKSMVLQEYADAYETKPEKKEVRSLTYHSQWPGDILVFKLQ